ncbi:MAG: response regulator [Pseudomonadota bacterium]
MLDAAQLDWSTTDLGTRAAWPEALRVCVDLVLAAPLPMLLAWGPQPVLVFNEAYAALAAPAAAPGAAIAPWPPTLVPARHACQRAWGGSEQLVSALPLALDGQCVRPYDLHFTPIRSTDGQVGGVLCTFQAAAVAMPAAALRILVVEDNPDAQYLVCEMLHAFGHRADGVADGETALPLLSAGGYQLLFSDVSLPGMSGIELARQALRIEPGLAVVFATGFGEHFLRGLEFPFQALQKPFALEQLQAVLASAAKGLQAH